jgi:hypothetical protein
MPRGKILKVNGQEVKGQKSLYSMKIT